MSHDNDDPGTNTPDHALAHAVFDQAKASGLQPGDCVPCPVDGQPMFPSGGYTYHSCTCGQTACCCGNPPTAPVG